jgi:predicted Zn-dependent peptidase
VAFVWGGPDIRSPEKPAFDVAQMLLCGGFNSRLMRSLRYEKGLVYSVAGQQLPIMGATSVVVEAECNPKDIDAVIDTIENDSRQLADEPAEEGELKAARNNLRIGTLKFMELQSSVPRMMTCREVYDHDPEAYFVSLGNITAQDVQQVVKKYLDADNYLLAVLLP